MTSPLGLSLLTENEWGWETGCHVPAIFIWWMALYCCQQKPWFKPSQEYIIAHNCLHIHVQPSVFCHQTTQKRKSLSPICWWISVFLMFTKFPEGRVQEGISNRLWILISCSCSATDGYTYSSMVKKVNWLLSGLKVGKSNPLGNRNLP